MLTISVALALIGCGDDPMMTPADGGTPPPGTDAGAPPPGTDAGMMMGTDAGPPPPPSALVDPDCVDGMFSEPLPDPSVDLSDLEAAYSPADVRGFIESVLDRRYSTGAELVRNGDDPSIGDCVEFFLRDSDTPQDIYNQMSTFVHECGHFYDLAEGGFSSAVYVINDSPLRIECAGGDSTDRGGMTYARSRIRDDEYQPARPIGSGPGSDFYGTIYLDGDPDDGEFDGGDQGFDSVMEEALQYVNSIATGYAFTNELMSRGSVSERDGILTFLWYVMRYLRMARLDFPAAYEHILNGDGGCWRELVLTVWGRAWLYLEVTRGMGHLGIDDDVLEGLVMDADLLSEIQRLRDAEGCPAP